MTEKKAGQEGGGAVAALREQLAQYGAAAALRNQLAQQERAAPAPPPGSQAAANPRR